MTNANDTEITLSKSELQDIREAFQQRGHLILAKCVRDNYNPRKLHGQSCVAFEGEDPAPFMLELAAALTARELAEINPEDNPSEHESTFIDHLDYLRHHMTVLGDPGVDRLLSGPVWYWPGVFCETPSTREELVQDVREQVESEVARRAEALIQQGFEKGWRAAVASATQTDLDADPVPPSKRTREIGNPTPYGTIQQDD